MKTLADIMWRLIALVHMIFLIGNLAAFFILPFKTPWYVWMPLEGFLINLFFNNAFKSCPITSIESKLRILAGKPPIKSFIGHYIFSPYRKWKRNA